MSRERSHHAWSLAAPVGVSVWPRMVGHIRATAPDAHATLMDHPVPHIVLAGSGRIRTAHGDWELRAGDLFCLWPGVMASYHCAADEGWEFCWLHLHDPAAVDFVAAMGFSATECRRRPQEAAEVIALGHRLVQAFADAGRDVVPGIAQDLQRLVLLAAPAAPDPQPPDLIAEALTHIRSLMHTGLNVNDLADMLHCDRSTLQRAFHRHLGESPITALNRLRLERAVELLQSTDHTVDTIARLVGYRSGKYLMRRCLRDIGKTTREIRLTDQRPVASR